MTPASAAAMAATKPTPIPDPATAMAITAPIVQAAVVTANGASETVKPVAVPTAAPISAPTTRPQGALSNASGTSNPDASVLLSPDVPAMIGQRIESWRRAWMSRDTDRYAAHYATDYEGDSPSHVAWLLARQKNIGTAGDISITVSNLKVIQTSSTEARASFTQAYNTALYKDVGTKNLFFQRMGDAWLIVVERFIKQ
jgi:hypothetical protein